MLFLNTDLKLEWPINVRRFFDSSKGRAKENSIIFLNWETFPGREDASMIINNEGISVKLKEVFYG